MANQNLQLWATVLLIVGGGINLIPSLYIGLMALTGGIAWIQIGIGALSVLVGIVLLASNKQNGN